MPIEETFFHTNLAETLGNANKLWYFCRAKDFYGSGYADIDVYETQRILNISHSTFKRYLKDTRIVKQVVKLKKNTFRVYYKGIWKLVLELKIKTLGATGWIENKELKEWRKYSALLEALKLQKQSIYIAKECEKQKNKGKSNKRGYLSVDSIFNHLQRLTKANQRLNMCSNVPYGISKWAMLQNNRLYIDADLGIPYGASHKLVSKNINCSVRTIVRRLKNVEKVRQAIGQKDFKAELEELNFIDAEEGTNLANQYFTYKNSTLKVSTFKHYCNIYSNNINLVSCKYARYKLNKLLLDSTKCSESTTGYII